MNDTARGLLISFIQSVFPVILLTGLVSLSDAAIGAIMLLITNGINLFMYLYKTGQQPDPAVLEKKVTDEILRRIDLGQLRVA